jgi:hypothetical protein
LWLSKILFSPHVGTEFESRNIREVFMKNITKKTTLSHKIGDVIERVGDFLTQCGASRLGARVYNAGNRIEHSKERVQSKAMKGV